MKTNIGPWIVAAALVLIGLTSCRKDLAAQSVIIQRWGTNVFIISDTPAFKTALESAPTASGPWTRVSTFSPGCPALGVWSFPIVETSRLFRVALLDNGIVPTPEHNMAFLNGTNVEVSCGMVFACDDSGFTYRLFRDGILIHVGLPWHTDQPGSGFHTYHWQAFGPEGDSRISEPAGAEVP